MRLLKCWLASRRMQISQQKCVNGRWMGHQMWRQILGRFLLLSIQHALHPILRVDCSSWMACCVIYHRWVSYTTTTATTMADSNYCEQMMMMFYLASNVVSRDFEISLYSSNGIMWFLQHNDDWMSFIRLFTQLWISLQSE